LTAAQVSEFVLAGCRTRGVGSAAILGVGMRALLCYLHLAGVTQTGLAGAVPSAASWPASCLAQPIDRRQAARLLLSCDRRTAVGRRDFAVLTLLLRLGLRVGEVAASAGQPPPLATSTSRHSSRWPSTTAGAPSDQEVIAQVMN
jgi:site-specific recombinase XerC